MGKFGVFLTTSYDNAHTKNSGFSLFSFQDFCCGFLFFWMWVYYFFVCLLGGLTGWLTGWLVLLRKKSCHFTLWCQELLDSSYSSSACWVAGPAGAPTTVHQFHNTEKSTQHSFVHLLNTNMHIQSQEDGSGSKALALQVQVSAPTEKAKHGGALAINNKQSPGSCWLVRST